MTFKQIIKTSLIGILLVPIFFGSLVALSPMVGSNLGVNLVPAAQAATTGCATVGDGDNRASFTNLWSGNHGQDTASSSRSMTWWFSKTTGWCYANHFAALNGDGHGWINITGLGQGGAITTVTAGADGDANSVIGGGGALGGSSDLRFVSSSGTNGGACCAGSVSAETYVNMIGNGGRIIDTVAPTTPSVSYPISTLYTAAGSGTVYWNASNGGTSGLSGYYVNYHWATLSNGSCINQGGDSGWQWVGNTTAWGPGWGGGTCFQFQVLAQDGASNQTAGGWSAWIESDQTLPVFVGYLNATCFSPGQSVTLTQSGSYDPNPSSGRAGGYYYENNWTDPVGWTTSNTYTDPVIIPAAGTQASYAVDATASDNAGNYQWLSNWTYTVDNTSPTGGQISASASVTNSSTVNLSFSANAGGCKGIDNVAISNNTGSWWYAGSYVTSFSNWNFTSSYGGNANQGTHTIYVAFHEAGSRGGPNGDGWTSYPTTSVTYDTTVPVTPPIPVLSVSSDTGTSHSDGLTSIHNGLVFTGTAEAGATVKVYADGSQLLGSGPATAGSYSITTTADLAAGVHTITVTATDVAGNPSSASSAYTVVVHLGCPF